MNLDKSWQEEIYRRMLRIRKFEEEGTRLYIAGRIPGAYHASIGEEATIVGACMALRNDDAMTGTHRSHGHPIGKGADLKALMAELMGKDIYFNVLPESTLQELEDDPVILSIKSDFIAVVHLMDNY